MGYTGPPLHINVRDGDGLVASFDVSGNSRIINQGGVVDIVNPRGIIQYEILDSYDASGDFSITQVGDTIDIVDLSTTLVTVYDLSNVVPNVLPESGPLVGVFYTITAQGGFTISQHFPTIILATVNPINVYDITNSLQVTLSAELFNNKLGTYTSTYNGTIYNRWSNDVISITSSEFLQNIKFPKQIISLGTYTTLYSDFIQYVQQYFSMTASSIFSTAEDFNYNNGIFDANEFISLINTPLAISGTITIYNINSLLQYAVDTNVFGNRTSISGNSIIDGFKKGDLILVPTGTSISLDLQIDLGSSNVPSGGLNQVSSSSIKHNNNNFRVSTTASMNQIHRVVTAPLVIELM